MNEKYYICPFCKEKVRFFEKRTKAYCRNCTKKISYKGIELISTIRHLSETGELPETIHSKIINIDPVLNPYAEIISKELASKTNDPLYWHLVYYFSDDNDTIKKALVTGSNGTEGLGKQKCTYAFANAYHYGKFGIEKNPQSAFDMYNRSFNRNYNKSDAAYNMGMLLENYPWLSSHDKDYYYKIARELGHPHFTSNAPFTSDDIPSPLSPAQTKALDEWEMDHLTDFLQSLGGADS